MKILNVKPVTTKDMEVLKSSPVLPQVKRQLRSPILKAFDIYKSNVYYGVITETETQHTEILQWYQQLLDLNEDAIKNVPSAIAKYL